MHRLSNTWELNGEIEFKYKNLANSDIVWVISADRIRNMPKNEIYIFLQNEINFIFENENKKEHFFI